MATSSTTHVRGRPRTVSERAGSVALNTVAVVTALLFLIPFYLLIRNSLATDADITGANWKFFPTTLHWENIPELFNDPAVPMARSMWNSLVVGVLGPPGSCWSAPWPATRSPASRTGTPTRSSTRCWPP